MLSPVAEEPAEQPISGRKRPLRHQRALQEANSLTLDDELRIGQALAEKLMECNRQPKKVASAASAANGSTAACPPRRRARRSKLSADQNAGTWAEKRAILRRRQQENVKKKKEELERQRNDRISAHYKKLEAAARHAKMHADRKRERLHEQLQLQENRLLAAQERREETEKKELDEQLQKWEADRLCRNRRHSASAPSEQNPVPLDQQVGDADECSHNRRSSNQPMSSSTTAGRMVAPPRYSARSVDPPTI